MENIRCHWVNSDPLYIKYHDYEWGVPCYKNQQLFEMICLEGQQAGLSWITILKKRAQYRDIFCSFSPINIANLTDEYLEQVLLNPGIIRNRLKVFGIRKNAQAYLKIEEVHGSFSNYIWAFVEGKVIKNKYKKSSEIPAESVISMKMSKQLKKDGFTFVGSKICYAFMQASGMVNDHMVSCFKY
ncbi:DNA-3-methyladenine glycosylase I [Chitinophagales bacterium]|jgi:DNA-3-methyladenine glycosylase I|nr:DNA-3-methyladenine glycosylase I [Chitinophagales bacterium]|tara:strand:+ start:8984 stop:9538 length:555 start_codon:yes stop_codon:yes gene_type:complete